MLNVGLKKKKKNQRWMNNLPLNERKVWSTVCVCLYIRQMTLTMFLKLGYIDRSHRFSVCCFSIFLRFIFEIWIPFGNSNDNGNGSSKNICEMLIGALIFLILFFWMIIVLLLLLFLTSIIISTGISYCTHPTKWKMTS